MSWVAATTVQAGNNPESGSVHALRSTEYQSTRQKSKMPLDLNDRIEGESDGERSVLGVYSSSSAQETQDLSSGRDLRHGP